VRHLRALKCLPALMLSSIGRSLGTILPFRDRFRPVTDMQIIALAPSKPGI